MKAPAVSKVLMTVNVSYRGSVDAKQLADRISDPRSADGPDAFAFAFFSDVKPELQRDFINEMKLDINAVTQVAQLFAAKAGFPISLAD